MAQTSEVLSVWSSKSRLVEPGRGWELARHGKRCSPLLVPGIPREKRVFLMGEKTRRLLLCRDLPLEELSGRTLPELEQAEVVLGAEAD